MTREQALNLIQAYDEESRIYAACRILHGIYDRFPEDGNEDKAMRWLGFCQGVLHSTGAFSLDELKKHSRKGHL